MGNDASKAKGLNENSFKFVHPLSEGSYGTIWKVVLKETKEEYSMKVLPRKLVAEEKLMENLILERSVMVDIGSRHPFIAGLYFSFTSLHSYHLVMPPQSRGSLFTLLRNRAQPFTEKQAKFYAAEVILGLKALHQQNYVYRDLKLENVALTADGHVFLHDFGFTRRASPGLHRVHSFSGSNIYISPEILVDQGDGHSFGVDWWALGVFMHLLLTQQAPFWADSNEQLFVLIREGDIPDFQKYHLSDEASAFLSELLMRNPKERLGAVPPRSKGSSSHPSEHEAGPNGAKHVMDHPFFEEIDWEAALKKKLPPPIAPSILREQEADFIPPESEGKDPLTEEQATYLGAFEGQFGFSYLAPKAENEEDKSQREMEMESERREIAALTLLCSICKKSISIAEVDSHSKVCEGAPKHP